MPAQNLNRPVPLVCEHCLTVIEADDVTCTWSERPSPPGALTISSGYTASHADCPERAFEHWSSKRAQHLPLDEIAAVEARAAPVLAEGEPLAEAKTLDNVLSKHGYLTEIDLEFAARLRG